MKKFISLLGFLFPVLLSAQTPPQIINKQCSANTFFSQIQPGPGNINCTQPSYTGLSNLPNFIRSIQFSGGSVSLVGDVLSPGNTKYYGTDGTGTKGYFSFPGFISGIGTIDTGTPSTNGATLSGSNLVMQSASSTKPGLVNNASQSFSGNKTFTGTIGASNFSGTSSGSNTGDVDIGTANGLSLASQTLSLGLSSATTTGALSSSDFITFDTKQDSLTFTPPLIDTSDTVTCRGASGSQSGCLSSADWSTFNGKQNALTFGNLTDVGTDGISVTNGTGSVIGSGTSFAQHVSDATHNGYLDSADWTTFDDKQNALTFTLPLLNTTDTITCRTATGSVSGCLSSADWSTFNGKQAAGNYVTALTGDGTAAGPGSVALTLATVNTNTGSFGSASASPNFTVNGKGLITAAGSSSIQIAESQVTNLVSDLAGKQATGNYITALTSDVVATGPGSVAATIQAGVVSNSKLATMTAHTLKANATAGVASPTDVATGTVTEDTSSVLTLAGWSNATIGSPTIQVKLATTSQSGYLSSTDWNTFNGKAPAFTTGNLTDVGTDGITVTGGTGAVVGSGTSIAQHVSDTTHAGYLTSTDWNTFNGKQASGNYITALTGDGTASGPGSAALTFATVNSNVGSFGSASSAGTFTVNAKGLVTAAASTSIQIAESQVTNLVSDLAGKQATGNYVTALTGDVSASGPGSVAATLATVNTNTGSFGSSTAIPNFTVNGKGLITAAGTNAVVAPAGTLSGTTLNSTVVTSSLTAVGAIATGTWNADSITISHGGTGQTTQTAGFNALSPLTTRGDIIYYDGTNNVRKALGATNTVLNSNGTDAGWGLIVNANVDSAAAIAYSKLNLSASIATGDLASGLLLPSNKGGTGVANNAASTLTISGNFGTTLTVSATTAVTLPTSGTLSTIAGSETLTNKTLTAPIIATIVSGSATSTLSTLSTGTGTLMPGSNWVAYTPTLTGCGTISNVSVFWRRVGDSVQVRGSLTLGTTTASVVSISLPSGANTIDTSKTPSDQTAFLGSFYRAAGGGAIPSTSFGVWAITAIVGTSTSLVYPSISVSSATPGFQTVAGSTLGNSTDRITFDFSVPVTQYAF